MQNAEQLHGAALEQPALPWPIKSIVIVSIFIYANILVDPILS